MIEEKDNKVETAKVILSGSDVKIKEPQNPEAVSSSKEICRKFCSPFSFLKKLFCPSRAEADHKMRENLSEKQIDKTLKDSFPASDPPSTY